MIDALPKKGDKPMQAQALGPSNAFNVMSHFVTASALKLFSATNLPRNPKPQRKNMLKTVTEVMDYASPAIVSGLGFAAGFSPQTSAIMGVATYAISNTPRVAAGPFSYAACVALCGGLPPCIALCLPLLGSPCP